MKQLLLIFSLCLGAAGETQPFWKTKAKVYKRIREGREIIVSVKTRETIERGHAPNELVMIGAGHVNAPFEFSYQLARHFDNLKHMSSMVKEARFDPVASKLYFFGEAFKYQVKMNMKIQFNETDPKKSEIHFTVLDSAFKGMTGVIGFEDLERRKTEISMTAQFEFAKLPIPKFFVEFAIEVAMQRMAGTMRSFIEERWREKGR